jgi:hypothetical protein
VDDIISDMADVEVVKKREDLKTLERWQDGRQ